MDWYKRSVLIIDDEPAMCQLVETIFKKMNAEVNSALSGEDGLRKLYELRPDLVILDILLPGMDGIEACKRIRDVSEVPIIMLTAVGADKQLVNALRAGADDYVTKPFRTDELTARALAVLRRAGTKAQLYPVPVYNDGYLGIDLDNRRITVDDEVLKLTATEFRLLAHLYRNGDKVCTFEQILDSVWSTQYRSTAENVHVYIWHLRQKIEVDPKMPKYIISEHSVGYRFVKHSMKIGQATNNAPNSGESVKNDLAR